MTCVLLVLSAVIRAALSAFLSCPLLYLVCTFLYLLLCWVNKERKKERKIDRAAALRTDCRRFSRQAESYSHFTATMDN